MAFTSPSGNGIKWITEIDINKYDHETWFRGLSNFLKIEFNLQADPACKDVNRACFLSYDPDVYLNPKFA